MFVRHTSSRELRARDARRGGDAVPLEPQHGTRACEPTRALANLAPKTSPHRLPASRPDAPRTTCRPSAPPPRRSATTYTSQVGLPDDELHRRIRTHRGVYGRYRDVVPNERALYHLVPARWFNAQLPIGAGRDGYVTEDFHVLGGIETFRDLDKLLAHANEQLAEQRGYFYVLQLDFDPPDATRDARRKRREATEGDETETETETSSRDVVVDDSDSAISGSVPSSERSFAMVREAYADFIDEVPNDKTGLVLVRAAVDVDCVQRVYVASRAAEASTFGAFTNVKPP